MRNSFLFLCKLSTQKPQLGNICSAERLTYAPLPYHATACPLKLYIQSLHVLLSRQDAVTAKHYIQHVAGAAMRTQHAASARHIHTMLQGLTLKKHLPGSPWQRTLHPHH